MSTVHTVKSFTQSLVGSTCLVYWLQHYGIGGRRFKHNIGIGVITKIDTKTVSFAFLLTRTRDFNDGTFSAMTQTRGNDAERIMILKKHPTRKQYGQNVSYRYIIDCHLITEDEEALKATLLANLSWVGRKEIAEIVRLLPKLHEDCAKYAKSL